MSDDFVKVNVQVSLDGHYSTTLTMPRGQFEDLEAMSDRDLKANLVDYINWNEVETDIDYVDEFEIAANTDDKHREGCGDGGE